jgi:hypothetical protein
VRAFVGSVESTLFVTLRRLSVGLLVPSVDASAAAKNGACFYFGLRRANYVLRCYLVASTRDVSQTTQSDSIDFSGAIHRDVPQNSASADADLARQFRPLLRRNIDTRAMSAT